MTRVVGRTTWSSLITIFFVASMVCVSGCQPKKARRYHTDTQAKLKSGKLIFSEDFSGGLDKWNVEGENWRIVDGQLFSGDKSNNNAGIWIKKAVLPENYRIEFKAKSVKGNNKVFQGDMKCEFGGVEPAHISGYVMILGGWQNTLNTLCRLEEHTGRLVIDQSRKVKEGQTYLIQLVKSAGELQWYLDKKLFLTTTDKEPLTGPNFGFNNWNSRFYIDDVKIFAL
jgi:Domain of unknown function (DUF6250)